MVLILTQTRLYIKIEKEVCRGPHGGEVGADGLAGPTAAIKKSWRLTLVMLKQSIKEN
jgi:hypothetical protein